MFFNILRHTGISPDAAWALSASGQGGRSRGQESPVSRGRPVLKKGGESGLRNLATVYEGIVPQRCRGPSRWVTNEENVIVYLKNKLFLQLINHCLTLCPNRKPKTMFLKFKKQFPSPRNSFKAIFQGTLQAHLDNE